jgi:hypothetical protein
MREERLTTKKILAVVSDPYNNRCFVLTSKKGLYTSENLIEEHRLQDIQSSSLTKDNFLKKPVSFTRLCSKQFPSDQSLGRQYVMHFDTDLNYLLLNLNSQRLLLWDWNCKSLIVDFDLMVNSDT